jgi:hypothetical protein
VDLFRELLAQSPYERSQFLKERNPVSQKVILAKLREYESLPPEERDLRLRVTELRWYLVPLMKAPAANRNGQLATVPERLRGQVEARLLQWDKLPRAVQQQVIDNEDILNYYIEQTAKIQTTSAESPSGITAAQSDRLEKAIHQWLALSEDQRQKVRASFYQALELSPEAKNNLFITLSVPEQRQLELTLRALGRLTPPQRAECLRSFEKLASMDAEDRQEFLKSAKHWEQMTDTGRQAWKDLLTKLSRLPPVPPGLGFPPVPGAIARSVTHADSTPAGTHQPN